MENTKPKLVPSIYYIPIIYLQFEGFWQNSCKETKEDNRIIVPSILLPISQVK